MDLSYLLYGGSCLVVATLLDGSVIFIVWGSCLSHCSMDLSYLLYEGVVCHIACWICHIYCMRELLGACHIA